MQLPGRLRTTTLGDLLGKIHRARATGTLELIQAGGRTHRIHAMSGLVAAVELDGSTASLSDLLRETRVDDDILRRSLLRAMASRRLLGEVLVADFQLDPKIVDAALRRQLRLRLERLDQIDDAQVFFRVTVRAPRGALTDRPLEPREFLGGRRRARDVVSARQTRSAPSERTPPSRGTSSHGAWRVLGLSPGATAAEIKSAYRRLVRSYHPDLHPHATDEERRTLVQHFAAVTEAYQTLVA